MVVFCLCLILNSEAGETALLKCIEMVRLWHMLPREAVDSPALEVSKAGLVEAWSSLV